MRISKKTLVTVIGGILLLGFIILAVNTVNTQQLKLEFGEVEVKSEMVKVKLLDQKYSELLDAKEVDQKKLEQLEAEKAELSKQLEARRAEKSRLDKLATLQPKRAQASSGSVQDSIIKWANHYGVSSSWLLGVAKCESGYNPTAVNKSYHAGGGNPSGLFQYLPETWTRISGRAGLAGYDKWNADHQARVTAWAFANGYSGEWACA